MPKFHNLNWFCTTSILDTSCLHEFRPNLSVHQLYLHTMKLITPRIHIRVSLACNFNQYLVGSHEIYPNYLIISWWIVQMAHQYIRPWVWKLSRKHDDIKALCGIRDRPMRLHYLAANAIAFPLNNSIMSPWYETFPVDLTTVLSPQWDFLYW